MSLWTPYAADTPLDLSKPAKNPSIPVPLDIPRFLYQYGEIPAQPLYYGYPYPCLPSSQMSPVSGGSSCSGYDVPATSTVSPVYPARSATLSPPESPVDIERQNSRLSNYMADADMLSDDPDFQAFERDALRAMAEKNGGTLLGNNPRMRRSVKSTNQDATDDSYRRQREKNNFAAKQSRDRRKLREIHLALKVAYLKNEVVNLKAKLAVKNCVKCQQHCEF